ncbi:DUF6074 family protein [Bosea sp. 67-29]|uniref:DUF6074 family protein n=1 Tax=unclassified Bosea (in: a-proteobacteria) TaxID=2653178 RepID=UPI00343E95EA
MGRVVQFPRTRDEPFVYRHARLMAGFRPEKAEAHLERVLAAAAATMRKRGIDDEVVAAELQAIESAVRSALWNCVLLGGGSA